ncbi:hypothetical protein JCM8097_002888 [Rhodosporidiobolus ruineniae]
MATIRDLPYELLELVLHHAVSDVDLTSSPAAIGSRNTWLRQCSTISRSFRCPAQAVLWSSLRVHSPAMVKRILASPVLGQFAVHSLDLVGVHAGVEGLSGSTAARVLTKLSRGLRWLRLADFGRLSARVLQNENLSALRTLILMTTFPDKPVVLTSLHLPFHLRSLSLFNRSYPSAFISRLFTSSSHTLRSLTVLTNVSASSYPALVASFPLVAPNLRHLSLQHRPSADLVAHFPLLTSLTHLECHVAVDLAAVLDALPTPSPPTLTHLTLELDYNLLEVSALLVARLSDPTSALRGLEHLTIPRAPDVQEFGEFGGQGLLEMCREKGIRVEVGKVVAWRTRSVFD